MANIDLSTVDWRFLGLMTALAFITALIGSYIAYRNRAWGAIIAAILFAIGFVGWNYYPHNFGLPVLDKTKDDTTATSMPSATSPAVPPVNDSH